LVEEAKTAKEEARMEKKAEATALAAEKSSLVEEAKAAKEEARMKKKAEATALAAEKARLIEEVKTAKEEARMKKKAEATALATEKARLIEEAKTAKEEARMKKKAALSAEKARIMSAIAVPVIEVDSRAMEPISQKTAIERNEFFFVSFVKNLPSKTRRVLRHAAAIAIYFSVYLIFFA